MLTQAEQKERAIKHLEELDIYDPYIDDFIINDTVTMFENFGGYSIGGVNAGDEEMEWLKNKIKELEEEHEFKVYAVTHEYTDFGECYDMLIVSKYKDDDEYAVDVRGNDAYVFCYVLNKDDEDCSEFGTCGFKMFGGGLTRVA